VVVDPLSLVKEITDIEKKGIRVKDRLLVSNRCHVVFPFHRLLDEIRETRKTEGTSIGTTKRGIGPTYADKSARVGLRIADLVSKDFPKMFSALCRYANKILIGLGAEPLDEAKILEEYQQAGEFIRPYVGDSVTFLNKAVREGKSILFEGAQGTMLDIDFGSYPYVTSSNATAGGAITGTGVPFKYIDTVVGVLKAYTTRVGEGPFPTELKDEIGALLGREGREFGATTGRPRRCGWFDAVIARYSAMINGVDYWALTKLDVLDSLKTIRICVAYNYNGQYYDTIPASINVFAKCQPVYEEMPGWMTSTRNIKSFDELPQQAKNYINRIAELTATKVGLISLGPDRNETFKIG
jgi:adenylosuccinate synthase